MYWAEYKGIFFVEGIIPSATNIRNISTQHDGVFSQSQLKSLDTLKDKMVVEALAAGGNAVIDFKYGQRNTFWRSLLSIDDVWWHASGVIAKIQPGDLTKR